MVERTCKLTLIVDVDVNMSTLVSTSPPANCKQAHVDMFVLSNAPFQSSPSNRLPIDPFRSMLHAAPARELEIRLDLSCLPRA